MNGKLNPEHPGGIWKCVCEACRSYRYEYGKEYRAKNAEFTKELCQKWRERNREKLRQYQRNRPREPIEVSRERLRKWREKNRERIRANAREYAKKRYAADPETNRKYSRKAKAKLLATVEGRDTYANIEALRRFKEKHPEATEAECSAYIERLQTRRDFFRAKKALKEVTNLLIDMGFLGGEPKALREVRQNQTNQQQQ